MIKSFIFVALLVCVVKSAPLQDLLQQRRLLHQYWPTAFRQQEGYGGKLMAGANQEDGEEGEVPVIEIMRGLLKAQQEDGVDPAFIRRAFLKAQQEDQDGFDPAFIQSFWKRARKYIEKNPEVLDVFRG
jgi:hypothetical protein